MERRKITDEYLCALDLEKRERDFRFLTDMLKQHAATFAFSSVNVQLGKELPLDMESLFDRIVVQRLGGYCFEQNGLMYEVLEELGFSPKLYLARVIYDKDIHPGLTHRISVVEYDGQKYVFDVGFGPLGPRVPVPLSGEDTEDGEKVFRVFEKRSGEFHVQVFKDEAFYSLYRFDMVTYGQADCELGHFYSHKHPNAAFVNHLVVSLLKESEVRALHNLEYSVIYNSGTDKEEITSKEQLFRILTDRLGVQVSELEARQLFEKLSYKV